MKFHLLITALAVIASTPSHARVPLGGDPHIVESLTAGRAADLIRRNCPEISARMLYALAKVEQLKRHAADLGYSRSEMRDFVDNPTEKRKIRDRADAWLSSAGARHGDPESFCRVGRTEISKGSLIGSVLRVGR